MFVFFLIGAAVQILLNYKEVIQPDGGFMPGLSQYLYNIYVQVSLALVGITNLILWLIDRHRRKKQAASAEG